MPFNSAALSLLPKFRLAFTKTNLLPSSITEMPSKGREGEKMKDDKLLSYPEAATFLDMALGSLYSKVSRKEIPHLRLSPRMVRFSRCELIAWIDARRVPVLTGNTRFTSPKGQEVK
jgi:predicted DNA-binding transcriptional regulator AlpA